MNKHLLWNTKLMAGTYCYFLHRLILNHFMEILFIPHYYRNTPFYSCFWKVCLQKKKEKGKSQRKRKKKGVISNVSWETGEKSILMREKSLKESLTQIQYEVTSFARWVGLSEMHFSLYEVSESSLCFLSQLIFSGKQEAYGQTRLVNCEAQENKLSLMGSNIESV